MVNTTVMSVYQGCLGVGLKDWSQVALVLLMNYGYFLIHD